MNAHDKVPALAVLVVAVLTVGCSAYYLPDPPRSEAMRLETWPSPQIAADYPERDEDSGFAYLWERPDFGIAFSGGGTRAASATWGQLRGLRELDWLKEARYVSAVSGGSWTAMPWSFLPAEYGSAEANADDTARGRDWRFLEHHVEPGKLKARNLTHFGPDSYGEPLSTTPLIGLFLSRVAIRGDETYSRALGKRFLHDLELYDCPDPKSPECDAAPKHRYLIANEAQWQRINERGTKLWREDFTTLTPERPYPITGASLLAKKRFAKKDWDFFPVEITPLYSGVPQRLKTADGRQIGNGYIESPGMDAWSYAYEECEEEPCTGVVSVDRPIMLGRGKVHRYRFTLSDALGVSGAAPVRVIRAIGWNLIGFPEFRYAPIGAKATLAEEYAFGDGGHIDNLGLIPLLARETANILVFVNSSTPFHKRSTDGQLDRVFQPVWLAEVDGEKAKAGAGKPLQRLLEKSGIDRIEKAYGKLGAEGAPLAYCGTFDALANPRFGIRVYRPNICWVYLDRSQRWIDDLPEDHKLFRKLRRGKVPFTKFYRFPHYSTFFHRFFKLRVIDLGEEQVNALAHLTSWTVLNSSLAVAKCFGLEAPAAPSDTARIVAAASGPCNGA